MDTEYNDLRSKEKKLEQELSQVRNEIKEILIKKRIDKTGKYYKNLDNTEFYKIVEPFRYDSVSSLQSDYYGCVLICFDTHEHQSVFIDSHDSQTLNEKYCVEITEEEFYEQYNKALGIIRDRLNSECNNSG